MKFLQRSLTILALFLSVSPAMAVEWTAGLRLGAVNQDIKASDTINYSMDDIGFVYGLETTLMLPLTDTFEVGVNLGAEAFDNTFKSEPYDVESNHLTLSGVLGYRVDNLGPNYGDDVLYYVKVGVSQWDAEAFSNVMPKEFADTKFDGTDLLVGIGFRYTNDKNLYTGIELNYVNMENNFNTTAGNVNVGIDNISVFLTTGYRF
uniref:outer membrane beta-barrel protein n=1 Tax=Thaumasiovibrio occultus TaxID=1891184 RepID=UPI000B34EABF|nr:outer membrane beta-barrel protein [Thaumasiovibrio occultus]